jgi:hypothetical protein
VLVRHLQRLDDEHVRGWSRRTAAKANRLRTVSLAYDDTLRDC